MITAWVVAADRLANEYGHQRCSQVRVGLAFFARWGSFPADRIRESQSDGRLAAAVIVVVRAASVCLVRTKYITIYDRTGVDHMNLCRARAFTRSDLLSARTQRILQQSPTGPPVGR